MGSKVSKDLLDLFEQDGIKLGYWGKKQQKWFVEGAMMLYDKPEEALNILRQGSKLFRQRDIRTFMMCEIIHKKKKKNVKLRRTIDENLKELSPFIDVPYNKIDPSKSVMRAKGLRSKKSNFGRDVIISRIVEKYRRLVQKNPKKFKEYLSRK
tara:strand:+ start:34 stop:492 length:459 start_codon:yes stop_codon:yes gene_type:complete